MKFLVPLSIALATITFAHAMCAQGMFGNRSLGNGISSQQGGFSVSPGDGIEQLQAGAGEVSGNERFVRDARQPGQFVGSDSGDTSNFFSQLGNQVGAGGLQGLARNANRANLNNSNNRPPLGTKLSLGFESQGRAPEAINTRLNSLLAKIPQLETLGGLSASFEGQTLVLRGLVASDRDRLLAARIASLEPGVYSVRNELIVGTDPADALPLPEPAGQPKSAETSDLDLNSSGQELHSPAPPAPRAPRVSVRPSP